MKNNIFIVIMLCMSLFLNSCGVIFGGSRFNGHIQVNDHPNAEISVNGNKLGNGSAYGTFPRNERLVVNIKQTGCEPKTVTFDKSFRTGNFILTVLTWGLVGIAVDLGTGASYKPAHNSNPNIEKITDKNYNFKIDYSECKN